jgi:hypothetical protein
MVGNSLFLDDAGQARIKDRTNANGYQGSGTGKSFLQLCYSLYCMVAEAEVEAKERVQLLNIQL